VFSVERKRGCPDAPDPPWWFSALLMNGNLSNRNEPDVFLAWIAGASTPPQNGKPTSIAQIWKAA
jgi:hypothetical protein